MGKPAGMCPICSKIFAKPVLKNKHIKRMHPNEIVGTKSQKVLISCPLCEERTEIKTHELLRDHLQLNHQIIVEHLILQCSSKLEYETWKRQENLETRYVAGGTYCGKNYKNINFSCNKNNTTGYKSKCYKRSQKSGGTIKMQGVCPSRFIVTIYDDDEKVEVNFWKTHVGHDENEVRSKHLSAVEKGLIVEKLKSGVPVSRIVEDAKKLKTAQPERINMLSRNNVVYLAKKFNIEIKSDVREVAEAVGESLQIKVEPKHEIDKFSQEEQSPMQQESPTSREEKINLLKNFVNTVENLDEEDFEMIMTDLDPIMEKISQLKQRNNQGSTTSKRKMDKQADFPKMKTTRNTE